MRGGFTGRWKHFHAVVVSRARPPKFFLRDFGYALRVHQANVRERIPPYFFVVLPLPIYP